MSSSSIFSNEDQSTAQAIFDSSQQKTFPNGRYIQFSMSAAQNSSNQNSQLNQSPKSSVSSPGVIYQIRDSLQDINTNLQSLNHAITLQMQQDLWYHHIVLMHFQTMERINHYELILQRQLYELRARSWGNSTVNPYYYYPSFSSLPDSGIVWYWIVNTNEAADGVDENQNQD